MAKWIVRIGIALILCLSSVVVFAQEKTPVVPDISMFCGDLAQADCDLLVKAGDAMKDLSSATFDFDVQVSITEDADAEPQTLGLTGNGSFAGHAADMGMEMMAEGADPAAMFAAMTTALKEFKGDLTLELTLPKKLLAEMSDDADGKQLPEKIKLELRLVDGVGYVNTETLKPVLESMGMTQRSQAGMKGWLGVDIVQFLTDFMKENADMMSQMSGGMMQPDSNMMADPSLFASAVKIERNEDSDGAASFTITFDFAKLAADPAFADMIRAQAEKQGDTVSDEELQKGLDIIATAGDAIQFTATELIDLESGYLRSATLNVTLDGSKLPQDTSAFAVNKSTPKVNLTATVNIDDFNSAPDITAPENALILPPEFLMQMGEGMMGGNAAGGSGSSDASPVEATVEATPEATP